MIDFLSIYRELDKTYNLKAKNEYEKLVNFSSTKNLPIHRWYYYVEGYSPELIKKTIDYLNISNKINTVFDPFTGSGTTPVYSKTVGCTFFGFEINPFSCFMANVKSRNYTENDIKEFQNFGYHLVHPINDVFEKYELRIIRNLFSRETMEEIESIKVGINSVENIKVRDLLLFTLLSILPEASNYRKGGNGLKKKVRMICSTPSELFAKKRKEILIDIQATNDTVEPVIINDSCLNLDNYLIPSIDFSIFSPPYANCFDPFEVYKIELWVGEFVKSYKELRDFRKRGLTSNLYSNLDDNIFFPNISPLLAGILDYLSTKELWDKKIPLMLKRYFFEMDLLLNKLYLKMNPGGYCVIVVGNSAYANLAIPTDLLLSQLAEKCGFSVTEIIEARRNETSSQQHNKLGEYVDYIRESIIVLKK